MQMMDLSSTALSIQRLLLEIVQILLSHHLLAHLPQQVITYLPVSFYFPGLSMAQSYLAESRHILAFLCRFLA